MTDPKSEPSASHVAQWHREQAGWARHAAETTAFDKPDQLRTTLLRNAEFHDSMAAALTPAPAQPAPPTAAGVGPVAWRVRYRSEPGMLGNYPWAYEERRPRREHQSLEIEPLYTTPPTLTDAQCDAVRAEERERWAKEFDQRSADYWHDFKNGASKFRGDPRTEAKSDEAEACAALIRAAIDGAQPPKV